MNTFPFRIHLFWHWQLADRTIFEIDELKWSIILNEDQAAEQDKQSCLTVYQTECLIERDTLIMYCV